MILMHDMMSTKDDLQNNRKVVCAFQNVISADIRQVLNGEYSYEIQVHCTNPALEHVKHFNIIQSNTGQYFWIQRFSKKNRIVTLYCPHIWYYLAHRPVWCGEHKGFDIWDSVRDILEDGGPETNIVKYNFSFASDIYNEWRDWDFYRKKKAYAILGAPNSIVNMFGGELFRDNFYFSINKRLEHSQSDAFMIVDGHNAADIEYVSDISDRVTEVYAIDNMGNFANISIPPLGQFPHQITAMPNFSYNSESHLYADTEKYLNDYQKTQESYTVDFAILKHSNKDSPLLQLEDYRIGDSGIISSPIYGINTKQRIIEHVYDDLRHRTKSCTLGNSQPSLLTESRYGKLFAKDDSPGRRLDILEDKQKETITREDIENLFNNP